MFSSSVEVNCPRHCLITLIRTWYVNLSQQNFSCKLFCPTPLAWLWKLYANSSFRIFLTQLFYIIYQTRSLTADWSLNVWWNIQFVNRVLSRILEKLIDQPRCLLYFNPIVSQYLVKFSMRLWNGLCYGQFYCELSFWYVHNSVILAR